MTAADFVPFVYCFSYYNLINGFANISYTVSCRDYLWTKCFKNCKNISTDGKVMLKIKVVYFFLVNGVCASNWRMMILMQLICLCCCLCCAQAAHVGIGISGVEGLQASCASDYSIAQVNCCQVSLLSICCCHSGCVVLLVILLDMDYVRWHFP